MLVCLVIGFINVFIRPLLEFISMPITFLTLGLFSFVVNALLLMLAGAIAPGFEVSGFWSALFGSIVLSLFSGLVDIYLPDFKFFDKEISQKYRV